MIRSLEDLAPQAREAADRWFTDALAAIQPDLREELRWLGQALADAHFALFANQGRVMELEGAVVSPFLVIEATRELNRTLELNPNHADALAAKGGIYRQLPWALGGSDKKAGEYLARSVELDYENACGARIELAELYRDAGQPEREGIGAHVRRVRHPEHARARLQQEQPAEEYDAEHRHGDAGHLAVAAAVGVGAVDGRADVADAREIGMADELGVDPRRRGGGGETEEREDQEKRRSGRHVRRIGVAPIVARATAGRHARDPSGAWVSVEIPPTLSWDRIAAARTRADGTSFKMLHVLAQRG